MQTVPEDPETLSARLLMSEYRNEFDRKGRIHDKTIGYFVIELFELMISLTATSLVFTVGDFRLSKVGIFAVAVALFSIFYFSAWSLLIALRYYRNHRFLVADIRDLLETSSSENIRSVLADNTLRNREINDELGKQNEVLHAFLVIDSVCFILFVVTLVLGVLKII